MLTRRTNRFRNVLRLLQRNAKTSAKLLHRCRKNMGQALKIIKNQ